MTETKEKLWRPEVGSLVVIYLTGTTGRVTGAAKMAGEYEEFYVHLHDNWYPFGVGKDTKPVALKGETITVRYEKSFEERTAVHLIYKNGEDMISFGTDNEKRDKWLLVQSPNDGAPESNHFQFNHFICWDQGKHESHDPEFRGGFNYGFNGNAPCANVKIDNPDLYLKDRGIVEESIGDLTDVQWERYVEWIDDHEDTEEMFNTFDSAIESAREGLDNLLDGTGLEYEFSGCSGGYICFTNVCDEETWEIEALTDDEQDKLDALRDMDELTISEAESELQQELEEREETAVCNGDKAVVRAACHILQETANKEVSYQLMFHFATKFRDMLDEEQAKRERYETSVTPNGLLVGTGPDYTTANYEGDPAREGTPPFHGPTRRKGNIRAVHPEKWKPDELFNACMKEADRRGWKLDSGYGTRGAALEFLYRTYYEPPREDEIRGWYGTYGVLHYDLADGEG